MIVYFNKKFIPISEVIISPYDRGFQFGDGVYEVIRFYGKDFFLINEHWDRLTFSLNEMKINYSSVSSLKKICSELIFRNKLYEKDSLLYIQITRGVGFPRTHTFPINNEPTIFISASRFARKENEIKNGVKVILDQDMRWERCDIKSTMLAANSLSKQKAFEKKCYETLLVNNENILEGTHTSFGIVKNDKIIFPPYSNKILKSITRDFAVKLCRKLTIPTSEESISMNEIHNFQEAFLLGTSTEITPVIQIDEKIIGNGKPGKITSQLQVEFNKAISKL